MKGKAQRAGFPKSQISRRTAQERKEGIKMCKYQSKLSYSIILRGLIVGLCGLLEVDIELGFFFNRYGRVSKFTDLVPNSGNRRIFPGQK